MDALVGVALWDVLETLRTVVAPATVDDAAAPPVEAAVTPMPTLPVFPPMMFPIPPSVGAPPIRLPPPAATVGLAAAGPVTCIPVICKMSTGKLRTF